MSGARRRARRDWTDENGTNIEQLAAIAVAALEEAGMIDQDHGVQKATF